MGGLGVSFLVGRARSSWLLLACVAVTVLFTTALAASLWTFAADAVAPAVQSTLAAPQERSMAVSGVMDDAGQAATDSQLIRTTLRNAWPGVSFQMTSALWAQPLQFSSSASGTADQTNITDIQPASLEGLSAQATLVAGTWPAPPHQGSPLPVALPAVVAGQLHLTLGSVLTGSPATGGAAVALQVSGLFRESNPTSPYWALDLLPSSGSSVQNDSLSSPMGNAAIVTVTYGPAVVNQAAFDGALTAVRASWLVLPQAPPLARGNISALAASTSAAVSQLSVVLPKGLQVKSNLPAVLGSIASTIVLTRSLFTIAALQLLLVTGAELVLAARLLASLREEESALLRARGATRWQVVRPGLTEAAVLGAVPGLAGVLAGPRLTSMLAGLGGVRLAGYPGGGITPLAWLSALAVLVLCTAVMAWPALHALPPDAARLRRGRPARLAGIAWAGADLALLALAAVSVWQLRGYSAVAHPAAGSLGIDPVVAVAPALALAGIALIPVRGLPLLARLADKATYYERRLAAAMVSWQIARRPIRQAGPALLVVVATATTTLALAGYGSWRQSAADQAAFAVGSDVQVNSAGALPPGATGAISQAPGVTAATSASVADIGSGSQLIALDASTAAKTILLRPDLSPLPLSALWQRITPSSPSGLPLPGQPDRLAVLAALGPGPGTSSAELRRNLGPVQVTASIQDATGATYQLPAGILPANARPRSLDVTLPGLRQASYPLRLEGLSLSYSLPPYDPANPAFTLTAGLSIESFAVADRASGPFSSPFSDGAALATWQYSETATHVPTGAPNQYGQMQPANAIIQAPPGQVISPALQRQVASVPGVVSTAAAVVDPATLPSGSELSVMFVDPARYAAVVDQAPGTAFPLAALSEAAPPGNGGRGQAAAVPAVATAAAAQLVGAAPTAVNIGTGTIPIQLAGRQISGVAGSNPASTVVVPLRALGPNPPGTDLMLVAGPGLDGARLTADVRRALPGGSVTLRATALAAMTTAPVAQAAQAALTQAMATAAGFGALVLLLSLLLTARTRDMTLAGLATMGLPSWQAQALLAAETLPPVVAAAAGGVACAWLLAPLVGPALNLAAFSGTRSAVAVTPAVAPLAASAAGLVLAALLVLGTQAVITYHRGSARALRIAD